MADLIMMCVVAQLALLRFAKSYYCNVDELFRSCFDCFRRVLARAGLVSHVWPSLCIFLQDVFEVFEQNITYMGSVQSAPIQIAVASHQHTFLYGYVCVTIAPPAHNYSHTVLVPISPKLTTILSWHEI